MTTPNRRIQLLQLLDNYFALDELRVLMFDLGIDYERFPGVTKREVARELILYCERRRKLDQLIELIREYRPGLNLHELGQFEDAWTRVSNNLERLSVVEFEREVTNLYNDLVQKLELHVVDTAQHHRVHAFVLASSPLFPNIKPLASLPFLFLQRRDLQVSDLTDIIHLLSKQLFTAQNFAILFFFGDPKAMKAARERMSADITRRAFAYDIICLGEEDFKLLIGARDSRQTLRQMVLKRINLTTVSPYVINGPTSDDMFFGRERELREITEHATSTSYALIGGRRMGKTSILLRLQEVRLPGTGVFPLYYQCQRLPQVAPTREEFLQAVAEEWAGLRHQPGLRFADILNHLHTDQPLVFLIDEVDKLIPADRAAGWPLFGELRALAQSRRCQFVFAGERTLREAMKDGKSPLFNFANAIQVGRLERADVEVLVTQPMKQLEIDIPLEDQIVERIWNATSGHPNVVQRLCQRLIVSLNRGEDRRLRVRDVEEVIANPSFQREDFYDVYLEQATVLERILPLVLADVGQEPYTLRETHRLLTEQLKLVGPTGQPPRIADVDAALRRLADLRNILAYTPQGYVFAVRAFPHVIAQFGQMTVEDELLTLTEAYLERGDTAEGEVAAATPVPV